MGHRVLELLESEGEEACLAALGPQASTAVAVRLVEADMVPLDALAYARTLLDLGRGAVAGDVVLAVIQALTTLPAQGEQVRRLAWCEPQA